MEVYRVAAAFGGPGALWVTRVALKMEGEVCCVRGSGVAHPKTKKLVTVSNVFSMSSCASSGDGLTSVLMVSPDVLDAPEPGVVASPAEARCRRTLLASLSVVVRSLEQTCDMCLCFDTSFLCSHPCTKEQTERERGREIEGERDYDSQEMLCGFDSLRDDREK